MRQGGPALKTYVWQQNTNKHREEPYKNLHVDISNKQENNDVSATSANGIVAFNNLRQ